VTAAADAAGTVAHAGTASTKVLLAIGAALAAALLAGCGSSNDKVYSVAPTEQCLKAKGERAVRNPRDPSILTLQWAYLRFHPDVQAAKDFDVSTLNTSFGGYEFHRVRKGNVSLIWATGGQKGVEGPSKDEVNTVERCLKA
jgi:hypothetical protein